MLLFVGLGNPGEEYVRTRHNIGREFLEHFVKKDGRDAFVFEKKWNARVCEEHFGKGRAVFLLPDTGMNKSGSALRPAARFFKAKPKEIFVLHDDADIPFSRAKLSFARGSAGHKGVESVVRSLGTEKFWRVRIGIQPAVKSGRRDAMDLVLKKFTPQQAPILKKIKKKIFAGLELILEKGPEIAMNKINQA
jgi:PTH1 family peptidyl-tRNA hydrolase